MNKKNSCYPLVIILLPVFAGGAESVTAFSEKEKAGYRYHHDGLAVSLSLGALWGKAQELVWVDDYKLSQLIWTIKQAKIIRAEINHDASRWLSVNLRGWTTLNGGKGKMEDYDWMDWTSADWTHWSYHDDTPLNYANEWDISLRGWLLEQQHEHYRAGVLVGYQQHQSSWTAYGGSYNYLRGKDIGHFPAGEAMAGYTQQYGTPYVGLVGYYAVGNVEFNAIVKFSNWVRAEDYDEHYSRRISLYNMTDNASFYSLSGHAGYYITANTMLVFDVTYTKYNGRGADKTKTSYGNEASLYYENCARMSNQNYTLSMGMSYLL